MINILIQCLFASLIIFFINATTWEGMIFGFVRKALYHMPIWVKKPLYDCVICMAPWYCTALWLLRYGSFSFEMIYFICIVGGMNVILVKLIPDEDELPRHI